MKEESGEVWNSFKLLMKKKLSIITVNRNNSTGLIKTISSVIGQTFRDFEYIIIDGDSQDESPDIIKGFKGYLSYWVSEPDKGTYHAMNKGIRRASGEYCLFLNSGDYFVDNNVLQRVFSEETYADILSGNVLKLRPNSKFRRVSSPECISLHKLCIHSLPHQSTLIRTCLFEEIGYYTETYKITSDWEFFLKALIIHEKSYKHIDIDVSYFKLGGVSSIEENFLLSREESHDILKKLFPKMEEDLMEYRIFYNSDFGQMVSLIKSKKRLFQIIDNVCGLILKGKKALIGK